MDLENKNITTEPCSPDDLGDWGKFLDQNFGYDAPLSYCIDFAPLFEETALENSKLVKVDRDIICSATLYPVTAVTPERTLKLGIIGAVATGEPHRGKGLSKKVIEELIERAEKLKLQGVILWSDQQEFYENLGFAPAGRQEIYTLKNLEAPKRVLSGKPEYGWDWKQVRNIYETHPLRMNRSDAYWDAAQKIKSCTQVQWISEDGKVLAYLGFDRGKDMQGVIHEWGGTYDALHWLLYTVTQVRKDLCWLTHPKLIDPIRRVLSAEDKLVDGSLGLLKVLDPSLKDINDVWFWGLDSL